MREVQDRVYDAWERALDWLEGHVLASALIGVVIGFLIGIAV